jgi:hypothetical protein
VHAPTAAAVSTATIALRLLGPPHKNLIMQ